MRSGQRTVEKGSKEMDIVGRQGMEKGNVSVRRYYTNLGIFGETRWDEPGSQYSLR